MQINPVEQAPEGDLTYWRNRVVSLEILVCELLTKNQHMRFALDVTTPGSAGPNPVFYGLNN